MSQKIYRFHAYDLDRLTKAADIVEKGHGKDNIDQPYFKNMAEELREMRRLLSKEPTTEELRDMLRQRGYKVTLTDPTPARSINVGVEIDEFNPDSPGPLV